MEMQESQRESKQDCNRREIKEFAQADSDVRPSRTEIETNAPDRADHEVPVKARIDEQQFRHSGESCDGPRTIEEVEAAGDAEKREPNPVVRGPSQDSP